MVASVTKKFHKGSKSTVKVDEKNIWETFNLVS